MPGNKIKMKRTLELYRWAGKKWIFEIKSQCNECDLTTAMFKDLKSRELANKKVKIIVKPWLDNLFYCLKKGGWHAPVVIVNGRVFSQGVVPDRKLLTKELFT